MNKNSTSNISPKTTSANMTHVQNFLFRLLLPNVVVFLFFQNQSWLLHGLAFFTGVVLSGIYIMDVVFPASKTINKSDYFQNIKTLDLVRELNPIEFEELVAHLFKSMGYTIQKTPITGDEGVDLFVSKDDRKGVVQCKRYKGTVGAAVLRDLYGAMIHNKVDEAYIVTTGTITLPAQKWASDKPIHLVDGVTLMEWVNSFDIDLDESNADYLLSDCLDVILIDTGPRKINVIKVLRLLTGMGLKEAINLVEHTPAKILEKLDPETATNIKIQFEAEKAKVKLINHIRSNG